MSSQPEAETESPFVTKTDLLKYVIKHMKLLIIGIVISIITFIYIQKQHSTYPIIKKIIYTLFPTLITYIILYFINSPKPRKYYFLNIMYGNKPTKLNYKHIRSKGGIWTFSGSAVLNINNTPHIFIGGGEGQNDALITYDPVTKKSTNIINQTNISSKSATFSAVTLDMDNNGLDDIIIGRNDGVFLYKQTSPLKFKKIKIQSKQDKSPLAISVSDYNKDNKPDIYISYFIPSKKYRGSLFNDPTNNRQNTLLKNTSTKTKTQFIDVTSKTNSGGKFNTFTSAFIDLNNDSYPDIVLANDSGEIEILENNKNTPTTFTRHPIHQKGNWMGLAAADIDNDGDQDLFLTNIGSDATKDKLSLGDITSNQKQAFSHVLLRNDGKFKFVDITKKYGLTGNGFGWGAIMEDLNNNTKIDLLFAENFLIDPRNWIFPGVGRSFSLTTNNTPTYKRNFNYNNPHFGQTPLLADLNKDNKKDVIWINMGGPATIYFNKSQNNYINVKLPETTEFTNAKISLTTNRQTYHKELIQGGIGFGSDGTSLINFGLGSTPDEIPLTITVKTIYNKLYTVSKPKINSTITLQKV